MGYIDVSNNLLEELIIINTDLDIRSGSYFSSNPQISGNYKTLIHICVDSIYFNDINNLLYLNFGFSHSVEFDSECLDACYLTTNLNDDKGNIIVGPNPASDYIKLKNLDGFDKIEVFDFNGNRVITYSIDEFFNNVFQLTELLSGIYIINASNDETNIAQKFIIQK
jgi:hypothetical protein